MYRHRFITIYSCLSPVLDGEAQKLGSVLGRLETNPQHRVIFFSAHTAHSSSSSRNFVSPIRQEPSLKTSLESHYFQPPKLHKEKKKPIQDCLSLVLFALFLNLFFPLTLLILFIPKELFPLLLTAKSPNNCAHTELCAAQGKKDSAKHRLSVVFWALDLDSTLLEPSLDGTLTPNVRLSFSGYEIDMGVLTGLNKVCCAIFLSWL